MSFPDSERRVRTASMPMCWRCGRPLNPAYEGFVRPTQQTRAIDGKGLFCTACAATLDAVGEVSAESAACVADTLGLDPKAVRGALQHAFDEGWLTERAPAEFAVTKLTKELAEAVAVIRSIAGETPSRAVLMAKVFTESYERRLADERMQELRSGGSVGDDAEGKEDAGGQFPEREGERDLGGQREVPGADGG